MAHQQVAHKAIEIAKAILKLADPEVGDIISNLKLQKLLYYVQGFSLAMHDKPIFEEEVRAWEYGPVVVEVYQEYKEYGSGAIPVDNIELSQKITAEEKKLICEVYDVYGQFSALKLMQLTHDESPWKNTVRNGVIPHEAMKSYFKTCLN